jgi:predicted transposase YbfD/YdcC
MDWTIFFKGVPDFRKNRRRKHKLLDILVISLCAVVCGADDFEEIALYGRQKEDFLKTFLELPHGIPSHDTFNRVFKFLDKDRFGECLYRWSKEILSELEVQMPLINIDGKVLRSTAKKGKRKSGLCIVTAWASEYSLVLGQHKVASKSNEKTAIPELLRSLDLENGVVSIDAIACEKKNADLIIDKKGHYLLALKNNQKHIYEQVFARMQSIKSQLPNAKHVDFGSGRIETRHCYVETNLELYDDLSEWTHLQSIIMIESSREVDNKTSKEIRFYLSDLKQEPAVFNTLVRGHWSIENRLHWMLDVVFREDLQTTKTGNAPDNLNTLRKLALQSLTKTDDKESIKNKRKMAGWDNQYLKKILSKFICV